jgi:hypothetical protein
LENTILTYNDHEGYSFSIDIKDAKIEGALSGKMIDADIEMQGMLMELVTDNYKLPTLFPVNYPAIINMI